MNDFDEANAHAYRVLNLVQDRLGDKYPLLHPLRWDWKLIDQTFQWEFTVQFRGNYYTVNRAHMDMFESEWYESAAEEIVAWLLLQRKT